MDYTIEFGLDVISKKGLVSRKNGHIDITTDATIEDLQREDNRKTIMDMIYLDVKPKLKQKIFNIEIIKIS